MSIAAPGNLHKAIALEAARRGKHILCEKPLANNLADAEEMLAAAQRAKVRTCCGFSYRSTPAQALAKQLVDEGRIGRIYHVYARYAQDWPSDPAFPRVWRFDKQLAGSGSLGDICATRSTPPASSPAWSSPKWSGSWRRMIPQRPLNPADPGGPQAPVTVDDVAQFLGRLSNGATACFEATRLAVGRKNHNCIEVNGDRGSVYWDFEEQNYLYFYDKTKPVAEQGFVKINVTHDSHPYGGGPWPQGHGIGYADTFVIEIANFLRAIANDEPLPARLRRRRGLPARAGCRRAFRRRTAMGLPRRRGGALDCAVPHGIMMPMPRSFPCGPGGAFQDPLHRGESCSPTRLTVQ